MKTTQTTETLDQRINALAPGQSIELGGNATVWTTRDRAEVRRLNEANRLRLEEARRRSALTARLMRSQVAK